MVLASWGNIMHDCLVALHAPLAESSSAAAAAAASGAALSKPLRSYTAPK